MSGEYAPGVLSKAEYAPDVGDAGRPPRMRSRHRRTNCNSQWSVVSGQWSMVTQQKCKREEIRAKHQIVDDVDIVIAYATGVEMGGETKRMNIGWCGRSSNWVSSTWQGQSSQAEWKNLTGAAGPRIYPNRLVQAALPMEPQRRSRVRGMQAPCRHAPRQRRRGRQT